MMVSTPTPVDRSEAANNEDPPDREKEFFITWLRLMERQKDAAKLTQDMQSLLAEPGDVGLKLQSARRQANLQSDNDKSISEVVALLNDYFFRDIVPALKKAKESTNQPQDPLDQYLEHGEEVSQDFVDDMSGWGAEEQEKENDDEQQQQSAETQEDNNSDDEIPSEMFHDLLFRNSIKFTELHARAALQHAAFQQEAQAASLGERNGQRVARRSSAVPPPIVTDLPPHASTGSTPDTSSRSPSEALKNKDRIGKIAAADLTALQVLGARIYGSLREYCIRWREFERPLWISRRKAPPQAKELIDLYLASEVRARGGASPNQAAVRTSPKASKRASRDGQARQKSAPQFYTVDHIVDHRLFYNKRQYLVRWENYDKSEDTWQDGDQLRADVPEIVEAYEQQRQREATRDEVIQSAMAELIRDGTARPKTAAKKRAVPSAETKENRDNIPSGDNINGSTPKQKKQRTITDKNDEDTYQFNVEEAELEEFSDDEFADKLNN